MRTSILPLVACALVLPSCTLLFNQERRWTDAGGVAADAGLDAFAEPDAPDANLDAFVVPDAFMRPRPERPGAVRSVSLNCSAAPSIVFEDLGDAMRGVVELEESFASFPGWRSFAMLANTLQIGDSQAANSIPSHAIWLEHPSRAPHVTWLNPTAMGVYRVGWDGGGGPGNFMYTPGVGSAPFVVANERRFVVGGGPELWDCPNAENPSGCNGPFSSPSGAKWGGFGADDAIIRARQNMTVVAFPESSSPSMGYPNTGPLRQVTGAAGGLYSDSDLFRFDFSTSPYRVSTVALASGNPRVSHDGTGYFQATIDTSFMVAVSGCDATCGPEVTTLIQLPDEVLVDWSFHALEGGVRVVVLLTSAFGSTTSGTHVSVATWREENPGPVVPLRIATGRFMSGPIQGRGRSIESVAELTGAQLDVYVSTLVNLQNGAIEEDHIYLSGFRLCL